MFRSRIVRTIEEMGVWGEACAASREQIFAKVMVAPPVPDDYVLQDLAM
jgi:hypothetical protein